MGLESTNAPEVEAVESVATQTEADTNGSSVVEKAPEEVKTPAWMAQLPGELKQNPELAKYATLGDAVKNLMEAKTVQTESEPAQVEEVQYENFDKKFDSTFDPLGDLSNGFSKALQSSGVSQKQAEKLFDAFQENYQSALKNLLDKGRELCEKQCREDWGKDYDNKRALMAKGYQALGDVDGSLQKALDARGVSVVPEVWDMLAKVGALVSEDTITRGNGPAAPEKDPFCPIDYKTLIHRNQGN